MQLTPSSSAGRTGDDPYLGARQALVRKINEDRAAAGLRAVELDALSSQVADQHCQEMAAHRYLSHWDVAGLLPYHRYHFAGGRDYIQENLAEITVSSTDAVPIRTEPEALLPRLLDSHKGFLEEAPPLDGHRKNVLDPAHTHVGIGLAVVGDRFTMAEEFINRYVELSPLPAKLPKGVIVVDGRVLRNDFGPFFCALFYEGWPQPRSVAELNATYAYEDMNGELCAQVPAWQMSFDFRSQRFRWIVPFNPRGPGYYHFVLWVRQPARSIPYLLGAGATEAKVDTKDGVPCASWIFRLDGSK